MHTYHFLERSGGRWLLLLAASIVLTWSVWATSQLMALRADVAGLTDSVNAVSRQMTEHNAAFIDSIRSARPH